MADNWLYWMSHMFKETYFPLLLSFCLSFTLTFQNKIFSPKMHLYSNHPRNFCHIFYHRIEVIDWINIKGSKGAQRVQYELVTFSESLIAAFPLNISYLAKYGNDFIHFTSLSVFLHILSEFHYLCFKYLLQRWVLHLLSVNLYYNLGPK